MPLALDLPPPAIHYVQPKVGLNASGFTSGPGGLILSWFSWWGVQGSLDVGVYRLGPATFSVGVLGWYNRPVLLERVATWVSTALVEGTWDYDLVDRGAAGRLGVGFREEALFQPRLSVAVGKDTMRMGFSYEGDLGSGSGELGQAGVLVAPGVGFDVVTSSGFVVGMELDYRIFRTFVTSQQLEVLTASGEPLLQVEKSA